MSRKCPKCDSSDIYVQVLRPYHSIDWAWCRTCSYDGEEPEFAFTTVFEAVTASQEALAEEFVEPYTRWEEDGHLEALWRSNFRELSGMLFDTKEEAITATLAKFKEVCDD